MTNSPTVSWFWPNPHLRQWLPVAGPYRVLVGANEPGAQYLGRISTRDLLAAAQELVALRNAGQ